MRTPFFGSAYESRSSNLADCRAINIYPEVIEDKVAGKAIGAFYAAPGLVLQVAVGAGPIRAMHVMAGVLYVVSGAELWSVTDTLVTTNLGAIPITTTGEGWLWDGVTLAAITLPFGAIAGPDDIFVTMQDNGQQLAVFVNISSTYMDGFGLIAQPASTLFFQSDLLDLATWDSLNFGSATTDPDNIVAIEQIHRQIFVIKEKHTEVWGNFGTSGFSFGRLETIYIEHGALCAASVARVGEDLVWLSRAKEGETVVVEVKGYAPARVSTHAIENTLQGYSTALDAEAYSYQQNGHQFYVLNFPTGDATWVYDRIDSALMEQPMWHQRAAFEPTTGQLHRHWGNAQALFNNQTFIGDYRNGNLYIFDLDALTDNEAPRKWLRSWRASKQPVEAPTRFNSLRIDMQTGIGLPTPDENPQCVLRWSDDGGHTWSNEKFLPVGKIGETARRVIHRRMGSTRRNSGLDRIYELSSTDQFPVALIGAELE